MLHVCISDNKYMNFEVIAPIGFQPMYLSCSQKLYSAITYNWCALGQGPIISFKKCALFLSHCYVL